EAAAVDYLLKPVKRERVERTLERLESRRADPGPAGVQAVLERLARHYRDARGPVYADRISVDLGQQRTQLVETAKITHFVAQGKGTLAVTASGSHLVDRTLGELEERLDPRQFVRIHRSAIVNLAWVGEVRPDLGGRLVVRLKDATTTELQVARDRARLQGTAGALVEIPRSGDLAPSVQKRRPSPRRINAIRLSRRARWPRYAARYAVRRGYAGLWI